MNKILINCFILLCTVSSPAQDSQTRMSVAAGSGLFLRQTKELNEQLMASLAVLKSIKTKQDLIEYDRKTRDGKGPQINLWLHQRESARKLGVLEKKNMTPELERELALEETLMKENLSYALKLMPEVQSPHADSDY
jgi:hypothetical protein